MQLPNAEWCTKRVRRDLVVEILHSFEPAVKELFQREKELDSDGIKTRQARRNCSGITEITRGTKGVEQGGRGSQMRNIVDDEVPRAEKFTCPAKFSSTKTTRDDVALDDTIYTHRWSSVKCTSCLRKNINIIFDYLLNNLYILYSIL